jgi:hypothetical protein
MCVSNPDRLPVGINRGDAAPTPNGFVEIISDYFPVFHMHEQATRVQRVVPSSSFLA